MSRSEQDPSKPDLTPEQERQIQKWEDDPEKAEEDAIARLEEWVRQEKIRRKVQ